MTKIPHKLFLTEDQMPQQWFNLRAVMQEQPDPMLHPGTLQPVTEADLAPIFCEELARQELDETHEFIDIPEQVLDIYKMYRPSSLIRAYDLEKALGTPAKIYYKYEGNNTSGSHKLNSAVPQAYYAKMQGLSGVTTETGAGQWGTALSVACAYFDLSCDVYMVKCSYEQKPFRKAMMHVFGADVVPSPSTLTQVGRKILAENPDTTGSLGCAISEAVEAAMCWAACSTRCCSTSPSSAWRASWPWRCWGNIPTSWWAAPGAGPTWAGSSPPSWRTRSGA